MRGNYVSPSELLQAQRETGKSYWDLIGQPLTPAVGYNINNPYSESEKSYKQWYNTDAKQTTQQDTKTSNDQVLNELIQKYNNLQASMNKPKEQKEYEYDDLPSFKKGKDKFTSFAQQLGPKIYKEMNKRGVYSDAAYDNVMRQLAMESSYGQSDVALKNHNYGGVGFNGKTYFKYKNDDAFVKDYIRMMKSKYGTALKAKNTTQYAKALKAGGYYQDSLENYTNKLNAMSSMSAAAKRHRLLNPKMYEYQVLLSDMEEPAVSTRVEKPINKEPVVNTPIQTEAPLIPKPEYLESNSLIRKSFQQNMSNMLQGREFQFTLPGFKNGKNSKKPLSDEQYFKIMEDVANENYKRWGLPNPDAALLQALNDNSYDYRGYYNKYPNGKGNAVDHWPDEFKTVYHPTFSDESIYSGKKSQYNPEGIVGGHWYNETFVPSLDQLAKLKKLPGFKGGTGLGYTGGAQTAIGDYVGRITNNSNSAIVGDNVSSALSLVPYVGTIPSAMDLGRDLNRVVHAEDGAVKDVALDALSMLPFLNKITLKKKGPVKNIFDRVGRYMRKTTTRSKYNNAVGAAKVLDIVDDTKNSVKLANRNFNWRSTIKYTQK